MNVNPEFFCELMIEEAVPDYILSKVERELLGNESLVNFGNFIFPSLKEYVYEKS